MAEANPLANLKRLIDSMSGLQGLEAEPLAAGTQAAQGAVPLLETLVRIAQDAASSPEQKAAAAKALEAMGADIKLKRGKLAATLRRQRGQTALENRKVEVGQPLRDARASAESVKADMGKFKLKQMEEAATSKAEEDAIREQARRLRFLGGTPEDLYQRAEGATASMKGIGQSRVDALTPKLIGAKPGSAEYEALQPELKQLVQRLEATSGKLAGRTAKAAQTEAGLMPKIEKMLGLPKGKGLAGLGGKAMGGLAVLMLLNKLFEAGGEAVQGYQYGAMNPPRSAEDVLADMRVEDLKARRASQMMRDPQVQQMMTPDMSSAQVPLGQPDVLAMLSGGASRRPI